MIGKAENRGAAEKCEEARTQRFDISVPIGLAFSLELVKRPPRRVLWATFEARTDSLTVAAQKGATY